MTATDTAETMRRLEETADAAMVGWAKAATEVERLTAELACMTAERDGYRDQLSADWQARQISDLMAAAGRAREERDEALKERREETAALDRVRALHSPMGCGDGQVCGTCPDYQGYPCQTIRALDGSGT